MNDTQSSTEVLSSDLSSSIVTFDLASDDPAHKDFTSTESQHTKPVPSLKTPPKNIWTWSAWVGAQIFHQIQRLPFPIKQRLFYAAALVSIIMILGLGMDEFVFGGQGKMALAIGMIILLGNLGLNILMLRSTLDPMKTLQQEIEQERLQKQILTAIAQIRDAKDLPNLLQPYLEDIRSHLKADRIVVYRFNPDKSGYIAGEAVLTEWTEALNMQITDTCIPAQLLDQYRKGRVVATKNVFDAGFHSDHLALMHRLQIKSNLVTPITQAQELYGLLVAHHCERFHPWTTKEISYLKAKAGELGLAMGGLGLVEQKQAEADRERAKSEAIQRDLLHLLTSVEDASSGDLTVRAQMNAGEIGIVADFFNSVLENVGDIVSQVKMASAQVNDSVESNETIMSNLAETSQVQTERVVETLCSVETMTLSIQNVAENARKASGVAEVAAQTAVYGGETIDKTVTSIVSLRDTVAETAKKVKRLGESSQQISKVVSLINQIALQTNLLAINASIEAARAGEEGRGFAVVAEEVGALAHRSAAATKEIEQIVETIQRETSEVVEAMEQGTTQVVEGTQQVEDAKNSLQEIVKVSREIDILLKSISSATISQAETSAEVKQLMESVTQASDETALMSHQVSDALKEAVAIARELQASVGTFKVSG